MKIIGELKTMKTDIYIMKILGKMKTLDEIDKWRTMR